MSFPKEIKTIANFLNSCDYDTIISDNQISYRSVDIIDKEKKCICFDASIYASIKLQKLGIETKILSMRGLGRDKNNSRYTKAHSVCIFIHEKKYGALGKHPSDFREPIYTTFEQIALTYAGFFYKENDLWLLDYVSEEISEYKPNDYEHSQLPILENQIYKNTKRKNQFDIKTIQDYLIKIMHFDENNVNNFLKYIQIGKK